MSRNIETTWDTSDGQNHTYGMLTYSFGLFKPTEQKNLHLIKKYHIDFMSTPNSNSFPLHPLFHMQSPGESLADKTRVFT